MTLRSTELAIATTGIAVWADRQARQVAPEGSPYACICTACTHTASRMNITIAVEARRFQRNSNLALVSIMDGNNGYAELYNEFRN